MDANLLVAVGGVGLFLLGMAIMTEGLTGAVGGPMRRLLTSFTQTPAKGAVFGALTTAVLQSSSATTVTTVGLVGAGLLTFPQALGILFGANIGTTITGWFVAVIGFKLKLGLAMMPLILVGVILRLFGNDRLRHVGWALTGFALLFVGIDAMKSGLVSFEGIVTPSSFPEDTLFGRIQLVLLGIVITVITQSSSAGVAAALVALSAGTISLPQAAAMVIGMDIGTTFTAALATVGGSVAARRTGYAHVVYNVFTGLFAFLLLGPYLSFAQQFLGNDVTGGDQIMLVAFHSTFNILGVVLVLPFAQAFGSLIIRLAPERDPSLTRRLDNRLLYDPASAIDSAAATVVEIAQHATASVSDLVDRSRSFAERGTTVRLAAIEEAVKAIYSFNEQIPTERSRKDLYDRSISVFHALDHIERVVHRCRQATRIRSLQTDHRLRRLSGLICSELRAINWDDLPASRDRLDRLRVLMRRQRRSYRQRLIERAIAHDLDAREIAHQLDVIRWLHRVTYHCWRIIHHVRIATSIDTSPSRREEALLDVRND